ncbi:unnamed protein product [Larinioides sclopetarius]|uniref:Uncharacterized protein n=1 Tax=Larinioides sclopetarius TaxID=280406 RepID=A0AAV1YVA6_9ARAC
MTKSELMVFYSTRFLSRKTEEIVERKNSFRKFECQCFWITVIYLTSKKSRPEFGARGKGPIFPCHGPPLVWLETDD